MSGIVGDRRSAWDRPDPEVGSGLVGTLVGVAVFAILLLTATNVLLHLHAASVVTAVAFDATRTVAGAGGEAPGAAPIDRAGATRAARALLGPAGGRAVFDWSGSDARTVRLRIETPGPHLLPGAVLRSVGLARISRTAVVRAERFAP